MINKNMISTHSKKELEENPEYFMRECFLRTIKESLENWNIDQYSISEIEGALAMLKNFDEIQKEK